MIHVIHCCGALVLVRTYISSVQPCLYLLCATMPISPLCNHAYISSVQPCVYPPTSIYTHIYSESDAPQHRIIHVIRSSGALVAALVTANGCTGSWDLMLHGIMGSDAARDHGIWSRPMIQCSHCSDALVVSNQSPDSR
jgi:hypothetical protein